MSLLVIDIGGSSVKSAIFQPELQDFKKFTSPLTLEEMKANMHQLISYYQDKYQLTGISFSVPGIPDQGSGYVKGASSLHYIHEFNFKEYFKTKYQLPIFFENDANCACKAEVFMGSAKGVESALFVVIGTGIGGAIFLDGEIQPGFHNFGGEFGMMLIDRRHEWSELGSAVHMARKFSQLKQKEYTGEQVIQLGEQGEDLEAVKACESLYHYLALGLYNLQYVIDPACIILSGGITQHPQLLANIERKLAEIMNYGQRCPVKPKLVKAQFGNDANLIGAGLVATQGLKE